MITKNSTFSTILASILGILICACDDNSNTPSKVSVNRDIAVAIYSTSDKEGLIDTISPCLLEETVHVSELFHYPGDDGITMPFNLSDTARYAEITESHIDERIAISVNGQVVAAPIVKMKLNDGACSVVLDENQISSLFPNIHEIN